MKRIGIGLVLMVALAGAVAGYLYLTTVTDVAIGPGWRLVAAARGGPWSSSADDPPSAEVISDQEGLLATWSLLEVDAHLPLLDFEREVVLRATFFGSSSCPPHLDGIDVVADHVVARASMGFVQFRGCSGDASPHTFMLVVDRNALPDAPFTIVVTSDSFTREVPVPALD